MTKTEQYIFEPGTDDEFYDFIDSIHKLFVKDLVMSGSGACHLPLHEIEMVNLLHSDRYCRHVLNAMRGLKPLVHVHYRDTVKCNLFSINTSHVRGLFLLQQIIGYPQDGQCMYSVWKCGKKEFDSVDLMILMDL
jgi:hypothetical protein